MPYSYYFPVPFVEKVLDSDLAVASAIFLVFGLALAVYIYKRGD